MKRKTKNKKTLVIVTLFLIILTIPSVSFSSSLINWENPNKNGDNPYKISFDSVVNSGLLTQVVACTGITNRIAEGIYKVENIFKDWKNRLRDRSGEDSDASMCRLITAAGQGGLGTVPWVNNLVSALEKALDCGAVSNKSYDKRTEESIKEQTELSERREWAKECFNGIAYTLAKNQLTSIARNTLNWVNSGFSGDPVYVQNVTLALQNVERSIVEPAIEELSYGAFPWGNTFIQSRIERIANRSSYAGDTSLLSRTASDLANYIKNDFKYNSELSELDNQRIRAESAVRTFANDFSSGGWTGWLSMIINDNNNYLGYQSRASRVLQEKVEEQQKALQTELEQNDGYYNQTECVKWQRYNEDGTPMRPVDTLQYGNIIGDSPLYNLGQSKFGSFSLRSSGQDVFSDTKQSDYDVCVETKAVTPGSNIKTRVDTTLGIPERQLEIADDINDVLNSVFSVLLSVLQNQGLTGLSSGEYTYTNGNMGVRTFSGSANEGGFNNYSSGSSSYDSFNLTRDLGNTFIYDTAIELGSWDANKNIIKSKEEGVCYDQTGKKIVCPTSLIKDTAPKDCLDSQDRSKKITCPANVYYVVSNPGKTKLADGSYSGWAVGDRAFWNGNSWQNWKCQPDSTGKCTVQKNPIKKRGVLQLQEDYSVAAKEMLAILPKIMPMIGELDYCIPGPNPSWEINTQDSSSALASIVSSLRATHSPTGGELRKTSRYYFPSPGDEIYENYLSTFNDIDGRFFSDFWNNKVLKTSKWNEIKNFAAMPTKPTNLFTSSFKFTDNELRLDEQADFITSDSLQQIQSFKKHYGDIIKKTFGPDSDLWREFNETENSSALTKNPKHLSMIRAGSAITQDIFSYDAEIKELTEFYKNEVVAADSHVYKLAEIKKEVSSIILAAQNRRANKMIERIKAGGQDSFDPEDFEALYKDCLDQENINYYDDLEVLDGTENDAERCSDGLDNDRDGFIDENDDDCNNLRDNTEYDNTSGYGQAIEPGFTEDSRGYNTYTHGDSGYVNIDRYPNQDKELVREWSEYYTVTICDLSEKYQCLKGVPDKTTQTEFAYKWECKSESEETNKDPSFRPSECQILKEIDFTKVREAESVVDNMLKDFVITPEEWNAVDYLIAYYEQKADITPQETTRLSTLSRVSGLRENYEKAYDIYKFITDVVSPLINLINKVF